jgi:hypothetical protein
LQLGDLRLLRVGQLYRGVALGQQLVVAVEIGQGIGKLGVAIIWSS